MSSIQKTIQDHRGTCHTIQHSKSWPEGNTPPWTAYLLDFGGFTFGQLNDFGWRAYTPLWLLLLFTTLKKIHPDFSNSVLKGVNENFEFVSSDFKRQILNFLKSKKKNILPILLKLFNLDLCNLIIFMERIRRR